MVDRNCGFSSNRTCDGNCSECAGANFMFKILEQAQKEEEERRKRYSKVLKNIKL